MFPVVAIVLLCCYLGLAGYIVWQIWSLYSQGHKRRSYKMGFCMGTLVWTALRSIYWIMIVVHESNTFTGIMIYWLPHAIQFMVFGLLGMFYIKLIKRTYWKRIWKRPVIITYLLASIVLVSLEVASAYFQSQENSQQALSNVNSLATGILYILLGIWFLYFGRRLLRLSTWEYRRMFVMHPRSIAATNFTLFAVFSSRAAFDVLSGFSVIPPVSLPPPDIGEAIGIFVAFSWWELTPIILLLATIATGREGNIQSQHSKPLFGVFAAIGQSPCQSSDQFDLSPSHSERDRLDGDVWSIGEAPEQYAARMEEDFNYSQSASYSNQNDLRVPLLFADYTQNQAIDATAEARSQHSISSASASASEIDLQTSDHIASIPGYAQHMDTHAEQETYDVDGDYEMYSSVDSLPDAMHELLVREQQEAEMLHLHRYDSNFQNNYLTQTSTANNEQPTNPPRQTEMVPLANHPN